VPDKEAFRVTVLYALLPTLAGAALVYLASAHQRLRAAPLPRPARVAGWLLMLAGTVAWLSAAGVGAGVAGALSTMMLAWVLLPYLAWWRVARAPVDRS
jgi:hypothetical protein